MDSERVSVRSNLHVYECEYVHNFFLGCFQQTCYVVLKKGTIYVYDSKRSCLNNPQKPKLFFNLNMTKIAKNNQFLVLEDSFNKLSLWSIRQDDLTMLEENAKFNKENLDVQKIFPRKFTQLNTRIDEKLQWQKNKY